jgi:hypothetical protein
MYMCCGMCCKLPVSKYISLLCRLKINTWRRYRTSVYSWALYCAVENSYCVIRKSVELCLKNDLKFISDFQHVTAISVKFCKITYLQEYFHCISLLSCELSFRSAENVLFVFCCRWRPSGQFTQTVRMPFSRIFLFLRYKKMSKCTFKNYTSLLFDIVYETNDHLPNSI